MPRRSRQTAARPGGKRARTRERLIDAAFALFQKKGIANVGLVEVASSLGMTRGAVYSSFKDKDELVFAVAEQHLNLKAAPFLEPGAPLERQMRLMAKALAAVSPAVIERITLMDEFYGYAMTRPALRRRAVKMQRDRLDAAEAYFAAHIDEADLILPLRKFVVVVNSVFLGLMHHRALMPDIVDDEMMSTLFLALIRRRRSAK